MFATSFPRRHSWIESCESPVNANAINSIVPQQIETTAEIELAIERTQFVHLELVDNDEVTHEIWEGWLRKGIRTVSLDFSSVPAGNHTLRARLYPENIEINIEKI